MVGKDAANDPTAGELKRRDEVVASLDDEQRKRFQHQVFLRTEEKGEEPSLRLQQHVATIIAKDLPPNDESRDIGQAYRDEDAGLSRLDHRAQKDPAKQPDDERPAQNSVEANRKAVEPPKRGDPTEGVQVGRAPRDYSELQATHDDVAAVIQRPDSPAVPRSRIDLLQGDAERMSADADIVRGARQLFEINQRRLDRQIDAGDPASTAALRTEKEASAQEYVGYLTDTIGNGLERDGRHDEAANMHREAEARREIASHLRSSEPRVSSWDGVIDNFGHQPPGVDAVVRGPGHYADLEITHAKVAASHGSGDDTSAERILARTNSEIIGRQQVEAAILTGGSIPPEAALTRSDIRAELKSMAADVAKRADGPRRDAGQHATDMPGRPPPARGGFGP